MRTYANLYESPYLNYVINVVKKPKRKFLGPLSIKRVFSLPQCQIHVL
jgi:hypothetical protein